MFLSFTLDQGRISKMLCRNILSYSLSNLEKQVEVYLTPLVF